ncbi:minor head protein inhibitor of protease [Edwardsiella phage PEi20]|uniref:Inhibitor of prohead protease gp21 n=1 Tax=Edwardsiella phage PEi20 TaxID=1608310 RepID=A0A0B6VR74_9CAUD|nr:minor head protein inhibitor of protease [Edwardsiella phage PEi20]BAQ22849.1 inhibitor of prohead protease gp21 [Edwardsiella phage PEi20]
MDYQYIEDLRALEDKKEAKDKLVAYAEQFGIKVKKTRSFENLVLDIEAGLKELASEPLPEDNEGLSISDLIDADDELEGKKEFIINDDEGAKEEAKLLFDSPTERPEVLEIKVPEVELRTPFIPSAPIGDVTITVTSEGEVIEKPVEPINEEHLNQAIQTIIESEKAELYELPANYSPSLTKIGPGQGYCTLPWWIYEWITKNPDWKSKPKSFPHHYGLDTVLSLIYYIKREGSVRIRETRNSSFVILD